MFTQDIFIDATEITPKRVMLLPITANKTVFWIENTSP
jgi:hypothetical protein